MKKIIYVLFIGSSAFFSCTLDKTDYEAELANERPDQQTFKTATTVQIGSLSATIETLEGAFYTGYNELRIRLRETATGHPAAPQTFTCTPVITHSDDTGYEMPGMEHRGNESEGPYVSGHVLFSGPSDVSARWALHISHQINGQTEELTHPITVEEQPNPNRGMAAFTGKDGRNYLIALLAPLRPKVGENELIAGVYRYEPAQGVFQRVQAHKLLLDPRMPDPSMGNHSSPNNRDLTQQPNGQYRGVVNYTMTGAWTLNFILLDPTGTVIKGTEVPPDFTPGKVGAKSQLHIDILF